MLLLWGTLPRLTATRRGKGLREYEVALRGRSSVDGDEPFAMHISALLERVSGGGGTASSSDSDDVSAQYDAALALRQRAIDELLRADADSSSAAPGARDSATATAVAASGDGDGDELAAACGSETPATVTECSETESARGSETPAMMPAR